MEEKRQFPPDKERIRKIIEDGDMKELNTYASELGKGFACKLVIEKKGKEKTEKELSTSQIRAVLDEIQRMREFSEATLQLLRPKLAYAAGRHGGRVREFQQIIEEAIPMVNKDNFQNFRYFIEAIVAYHRYHGGKE